MIISSIESEYPAVRARMSILRITSRPERSSHGFGSVYFFVWASRTMVENWIHFSSSEQIYARVPEKHPSILVTIFLVSYAQRSSLTAGHPAITDARYAYRRRSRVRQRNSSGVERANGFLFAVTMDHPSRTTSR